MGEGEGVYGRMQDCPRSTLSLCGTTLLAAQ